MPRIPTATQLGETWAGLSAGGTIPEELRTSGMDNMGKLAYLTKDFTAFVYLLQNKFGKKKNIVKDRQYNSYEIDELARMYTVTVGSDNSVAGDTYHRIFGISNEEAAQLQPQDVLIIKGLFATPISNTLYAGQVNASNQVPTTPTTPPSLGYNIGDHVQSIAFGDESDFGMSSSGVPFVEYEQVLVKQVGSPDSGGTGNALITVERCYMGTSRGKGGAFIPRSVVNSANGVLNTTTGAGTGGLGKSIIKEGMTILRASPAFKEGTNAPSGLYKNPDYDFNFTQEIKYAVEHTKEQDLRTTWISEKPLTLNRWLTSKRMLRDYEFMTIFGRRGYGRDNKGREIFLAGGVLDFIAKDKDHLLKYKSNSLNWVELCKMGPEIFSLGGSSERFMFTGYSLDSRLKAMFYESGIMRIEPKLTKQFNIEVNALVLSGGKLNIVPSQVMEEAGWGKRAILLDLSVPSFVPVTHKGWDMHVDNNGGKGIQEAGLQTYKEQVIGMKGLQRRYRDYQAVIDFSNIP